MPDTSGRSTIETLRADFHTRLAAIATDRDLKTLNDDFLSRRNGSVTALLKSLGTIPADTRREFGQLVNTLKAEVESAINDRRTSIESARPAADAIDVTLPCREIPHRTHPSTDVGPSAGRGYLCAHGLRESSRGPKSKTTTTTSRRSTCRPIILRATCRTRYTSACRLPAARGARTPAASRMRRSARQRSSARTRRRCRSAT